MAATTICALAQLEDAARKAGLDPGLRARIRSVIDSANFLRDAAAVVVRDVVATWRLPVSEESKRLVQVAAAYLRGEQNTA